MTSLLKSLFSRKSKVEEPGEINPDIPDIEDSEPDPELMQQDYDAELVQPEYDTELMQPDYFSDEGLLSPLGPQLSIQQNELSSQLQFRQMKLEQLKAEFKKVEQSAKSAEDLSQNTSGHLSGIRAFLHDAELEIDRQARVERENRLLRTDVGVQLEQLAKLRSAVEDKDAQLQSLKARSAETRDALQQAHVDMSQHVNALKERSGEIERLAIELNEKRKDLQTQTDICNSLTAENNEITQLNQTLKEEFASTSRVKTELEKEVGEWKRIQKFEEARKEGMMRDLEEFKSRLADVTRAKIDLESQLEVILVDLHAQAKHFKEQLRSREDRIYSLESNVEGLDSKLRINAETTDHMKNENNELIKMLATNEERSTALKQRNEEIKKQHNEDRDKLFSAIDRISELDVRVSGLVSDLEQAKQEKDAFSSLVDRLTRDNKKLNMRIVQLSSVEDEEEIRQPKKRKVVKSKKDETPADSDNVVVSIGSKKLA